MAILDKYKETSKNPLHWKSRNPIEDFKKAINKYISNPQGMKLVDVGCDEGKEVALLSKLGFNVEGVDIEPEFIKRAKKRLPALKFKKGDAEKKLPYKANTFDVVFSSNTLCYTNLNKSIPELIRILKRDGFLIISLDKRMVDLRSKDIMQKEDIRQAKKLIKEKAKLLYMRKRKRIDMNPFMHKHLYYVVVARKR